MKRGDDMRERQSLTREQIVERLGADPLLADFIAPFPNLLSQDKTDIAGSFGRMAALLATADRAALLQFTISNGREVRCWCLTLTPDSCKASEGKYERPDLEILTTAEVWLMIASGELSLLEAFGQGKLRVRGDIALARFASRKLRGLQGTR
jgi:putative sterol carrier protein